MTSIKSINELQLRGCSALSKVNAVEGFYDRFTVSFFGIVRSDRTDQLAGAPAVLRVLWSVLEPRV